MRIVGVDFTSAPGPNKPLVAAQCYYGQGVLDCAGLAQWPRMAPLAELLAEPGWDCIALDFPFGLPAAFVEAMGWPRDWAGYVDAVAGLGQPRFMEQIRAFKASRPPGEKDLKRLTDRCAWAASPLNITFPPVGRMFLVGAPLLCRAGLSVVPCRQAAGQPVAVEAYPALIPRAVLPGVKYKDTAEPAGRRTREAILRALTEGVPAYGIGLRLSSAAYRQAVEDRRGDCLDALLCAYQGAWAAAGSLMAHLPLPPQVRSEGWIMDPALLSRGD